ncbi:MutS protein msh5 [Ascosphaera atra]|nr:MutS protein msh5 [Ascosphaera atra]
MAPVAAGNLRYAGSFRSSSQASSRGRKPPSSSRKRGRYRPSQRAQRTPLSNARASATPSVISNVTPSVSSTILTSGSRPWINAHRPGVQFQGQLLPEASSVGRPANQEVQDDSTFDNEAQIVMAIDIKSKDTVGCCYYVSDEQTLYLLEDITSGGNDMVEKLKVDINPTVVLISTRADQSPTSYPSGDRSDLETETGDGAKFFVPAESYVAGGNGDDSEGLGLTDQQGKLLALSGFLNMDSHVTIGCVGALLTYLERKRSVICTVGEQLGGNVLGIKSIEMLSLEGTMFVSHYVPLT